MLLVTWKHLFYFLRYIEKTGFEFDKISTNESTVQIEVEHIFRQKNNIIHRKKRFNENFNDDITHSGEETFRVDYFLNILIRHLLHVS